MIHLLSLLCNIFEINFTHPRSVHEGASIWSADVDREHGLLYTGGGDAALKSWPLESLNFESSTELEYPKSETGYARTVVAFNDSLLCLTTTGKVFDVKPGAARLLINDPDLASYAVINVLSEDRIAFATIDGRVKIWTAETANGHLICQLLIDEKVHDGKIFSMEAVSANELLTCGRGGEMKLVAVEGSSLTSRCRLLLPESKEQRWFSCATVVESIVVVVGDRCGSLHFYR